MSFVAHQSQPEGTIPLIYRLQRLFFAACIILGMAFVLVLVFTNPSYYGSQPGVVGTIAIDAKISNVMVQIYLTNELIASYLLPLAFLAMAWLANRRAPWLASIAAVITLIGVLPGAVFVAQDSLSYDIARLGANPLLVDMAQRFDSDGIMTYYKLAFGLCTVFGPTLIGIALWRARAVPLWSAIVITFSRLSTLILFPLVPFRFGVIALGAGFLLLAIGSIPAAWAVLKASGEGRSAK
jgi:hypothetical protein